MNPGGLSSWPQSREDSALKLPNLQTVSESLISSSSLQCRGAPDGDEDDRDHINRMLIFNGIQGSRDHSHGAIEGQLFS